MKRSDAEILADLARELREGEEDGSIHSNPTSEYYLKDLLDDEQDECRKHSTASEEHSKDESQQEPPLTKEQSRSLLIDFLDQIAASKPSASTQEPDKG
jgi:hypothetical protein